MYDDTLSRNKALTGKLYQRQAITQGTGAYYEVDGMTIGKTIKNIGTALVIAAGVGILFISFIGIVVVFEIWLTELIGVLGALFILSLILISPIAYDYVTFQDEQEKTT